MPQADDAVRFLFRHGRQDSRVLEDFKVSRIAATADDHQDVVGGGFPDRRCNGHGIEHVHPDRENAHRVTELGQLRHAIVGNLGGRRGGLNQGDGDHVTIRERNAP